MAYEEKAVFTEAAHSLTLEGRKKLSLTGVRDVDSFNEELIALTTAQWTLTIRGEGLKMERMSVDSGDVVVTGRINALEYEDALPQRGGFFRRLFG